MRLPEPIYAASSKRRGQLLPLLLAFGLIARAVGAVSAPPPAPEYVLALDRAVTAAILAGDYRAAERSVETFRDTYPNQPAGPLYAASVIQYMAVDYEEFSRDGELYSLIGETVRLADGMLAENPDDDWTRFFRAAANGLAGAHASLTGKVLTGIIRGRAGASAMNDLIEDDASFYDAYLMAGSYRFWKSVAAAPVAWLPFVGDDRERGIAETETAVEKGVLTGPLGNTVLLEMLIEHDPARARDLAYRLHDRYPSCRLFSWQLGEAYKRLGDFGEARRIFEAIADSMRDDPRDDGSGELRCWWKLADLARTIGDRCLAADYGRRVIETGERPGIADRQRERIAQARQLLEECPE